MRRSVGLVITILAVLSFLIGCAQGTPAVAPTKPAAPAAAASVAAPTAPAASTAAAPAATKPAAAAATAPPAAPVAKVKRGGTLTMGYATSYADLDVHRGVASGPVTYTIFEPLLEYELTDPKAGKFEVKAGLAEEWKNIDPKTIEFKLRKGVKFQDGSDWNAEVAKWNLDRLRTDPKSVGKVLVAEINSVEVIDPLTIRLKMDAPTAPLFVRLTAATGGPSGGSGRMASKAAVDKGGDTILSTKPVGTGPMVLDQWLRDDRIILKKWDGYWKQGADGKPLPYLDGFVERVIPDLSVQVVELRSNNIQMAEDVDSKDVATIKSNPELVYYETFWAGTAYFTTGLNQHRPPFQNNRKLAQAVQYAIDRENMAKVMGFGMGQPAYYVFWQPLLLGFNDNIPKYKFDQAKSKQLMAEAGYPNGVDIEMQCSTRGVDPRLAELGKSMLDAVGFRTTANVIERLAAISKAKAGDFGIYLWREPALPDPDIGTRMLTCNAAANWSNYCNPEVDKCMAEGRSTYDDKERQKIYERCLTLVQEDALFGSGYFVPANKVYNKSVQGLKIHWGIVDVREVWLDK
jgi:peptide/nickel transport system substrate-binding protein